MADKSKKPRRGAGNIQNRASNISLAPLTPEQAIKGMFAINPADVKRIVASKPEKKK